MFTNTRHWSKSSDTVVLASKTMIDNFLHLKLLFPSRKWSSTCLILSQGYELRRSDGYGMQRNRIVDSPRYCNTPVPCGAAILIEASGGIPAFTMFRLSRDWKNFRSVIDYVIDNTVSIIACTLQQIIMFLRIIETSRVCYDDSLWDLLIIWQDFHVVCPWESLHQEGDKWTEQLIDNDEEWRRAYCQEQ